MLFNLPRGWDATGVLGVKEEWRAAKKQPIVYTYKRALHYVDFMEQKGARRFMDKFNDFYYVIGHVRASTVGRDDDANAHPFIYGDISLVHNGTVYNKAALEKADEEVDSAYVAATMAKKGEIETLEKLEGGYSLVWHNHKDDTLNFARNDKKPMAIAFAKGKNEMYYASEYRTLYAVLGRNDVEIEGPIFVTRPGIHYKFYKEDVRAYDKEGFKIWTRPQSPSNAGPAWKETVHRGPDAGQTGKKTDTTSGVPATNASTSTNSEISPESSGGEISTTIKLMDRAVNPPITVSTLADKALSEYGLKTGQTLILEPSEFRTFVARPSIGIMTLIKPGDLNMEKLAFKVYNVKAEDYENYSKGGRVACILRNFVKQDGKFFDAHIPCIINEELQQVIENRQGVFKTLKETNNGPVVNDFTDKEWDERRRIWVKKEGSKSFNEIIDTEAIEDDINRFVDGPDGVQITWGRFKELCARNCGHCDGDIDPVSSVGRVSFHGEHVICELCAADPSVKHSLGLVH